MRNPKQDNNVTDITGMHYVENEIELSLSIKLGTVYYEDQIGQQCQ